MWLPEQSSRRQRNTCSQKCDASPNFPDVQILGDENFFLLQQDDRNKVVYSVMPLPGMCPGTSQVQATKVTVTGDSSAYHIRGRRPVQTPSWHCIISFQ